MDKIMIVKAKMSIFFIFFALSLGLWAPFFFSVSHALSPNIEEKESSIETKEISPSSIKPIEKNSPSITILDNQIYGNNVSAIKINGHQVFIEKCRIFGNGYAGIVVDEEARAHIKSNQIYDQDGSGITVLGRGMPQVEIIDNQVYQNTKSGLNFGEKDRIPAQSFMKHPLVPHLPSRTEEGEGTEGKQADLEYPINIMLTGNRIYDNGEAGIKSQAEYPEHPIHLVISHNSIFKNQKGGIFMAKKAEAVMHHNFIYKNKKAGLAANKKESYSPKLDIYQNTIWGNEEAGLDLVCAYTGEVGISNNWILHNGGSGVRFESTPMRIVNNTIVSNGNLAEGSGIEQVGKKTSFLIFNNILAYNFKTGIGLKKGKSYSYNLLYANDGAGNCCDDCYTSSKLVESKEFGGGKRREGDLICDPVFRQPDRFDFQLKEWSPAIDAGLSLSEFNDKHFPPSQGGKRNDLGATGGPLAISWDPNIYLP